MKRKLQLPVLLGVLRSVISAFPDSRTGKNTQYSMETIGMTAFSAFFMQSPSFRSHQKLMKQLERNDNASNVFALEEIPCDNQVRTVLDEVCPEHLLPFYDDVFARLDRSGVLAELRGFQDDILIVLDGTRYFSSKKICCQNCSSTTHKDGSVTYYHSAIVPAIVVPGSETVIPLAPEFIVPQDGSKKQDCEVNGAKRWIDEFRRTHKRVSVTLLGDDLYSRQPMCEKALEQCFNFIFVCKLESHPTLYARLEELEQRGEVHSNVVRRFTDGKWKLESYKYAFDLPLRDGDDALKVNWIELTSTDEKTKEVVYHNAFITKHGITNNNAEAVVTAGRSRWKIENEDYNTLKNQGYNLGHNYGHGEKYLSSLLASLLFIAFLLHSLLELFHGEYQLLKALLPSRKELFSDLRTLLRYICFESINALFHFMVCQLERDYAPG